MSFQEIPGLEHCEENLVETKERDTKIKNILCRLKNDKAAWPFLKPVDAEEVPEYYDYIAFPMDFQTITERCKSKFYTHVSLHSVLSCYHFSVSLRN